jgi:radical SAM superfamily enzyme YgiQ (UPF0313 family)
MKVLFIYTDVGSATGYSAGIGILSSVLKQHGHSTSLLHVSADLGYPLDLERIVADVRRSAPDAICFSATTNQWHHVKAIGAAIRGSTATPIVVGGHHPTADADRVMAEPWVDVVVRGEGDEALPAVLARLDAGRDLAGIPNVMHRGARGVVREPLTSWIRDLDTLPLDDYGLFDYARIVETRSGWAEVIVTRGCPYDCSYCFNQPLFEQYRNDSTLGGARPLARKHLVRRRSVDKSLEILRHLKTAYPNIRGFTFVDDIMAMEGEWIEAFTDRYAAEIGLPYACTSHPLLFSEPLANRLKRTGCKVVKMGIEAGNPEIRKKVLKRSISNDHLRRVFEIARACGLKPQAFNMIGIPGEGIPEMMETVRLNAEIKPYIVWLSTFTPYPGTQLYRECVQRHALDEERMEQVDSYRGDTILKEEYLSHLALTKLRVLFRWHLNAALGNGCASAYQAAIDDLAGRPEQAWNDGTAEREFAVRDRELDEEQRRNDVSHYVSKKYINVFWGREYGYDLT